MASLLILKGANQGTRLDLDQDRMVMGRNPDCHVVISGTAVSRAHAHIIRSKGSFFLEDLGSRNKTFINNQEIAPRKQVLLRDNDRIKICDFLCVFHDEARKPLPPEMRPEEPEPNDEPHGSTTIEVAVTGLGSRDLLETQPAEKIKALLDITTNLCKGLALDSLWPRIVDSLFLLFKQADRCFIILREDGTKLISKIVKTRRAQDETYARFSRKIVNQCLDNVQALLSDNASSDQRFASSQSIADFRIRSVMCVPLWYQDGKAFGVIQLDSQDPTKKFTADDLELLMAVARQASVALENAKLHQDQMTRMRYEHDLDLAREVQRGFLPTAAPNVPGYEFFAHYEAAQEVGGDYYDFIALPGQRVAVMLGDVAGKGIAAALLMARISSDARTCMLTEPSPDAAMCRLNDMLFHATHTDRFVTIASALLDPATHTVSLVNAGHPSPMIVRPAGTCDDALTSQCSGLPIGVQADEVYNAYPIVLEPGDCLLLFSDGVTDAMSVDDHPFLVEGIRAALRGQALPPKALGEHLIQTVKRHAAGRSQHDDLTLVCFGRVK